jgi:hypothetical protein
LIDLDDVVIFAFLWGFHQICKIVLIKNVERVVSFVHPAVAHDLLSRVGKERFFLFAQQVLRMILVILLVAIPHFVIK